MVYVPSQRALMHCDKTTVFTKHSWEYALSIYRLKIQLVYVSVSQ